MSVLLQESYSTPRVSGVSLSLAVSLPSFNVHEADEHSGVVNIMSLIFTWGGFTSIPVHNNPKQSHTELNKKKHHLTKTKKHNDMHHNIINFKC